MQFSFAKSCLLALASISAVVAQTTPGFDVMSAPTSGQVLPAGQVYTITWTPSTAKGQTGPVTITLLQGKDPASLQTSVVIASAIDSAKGTYPWNIPTTLTDAATFGFEISLDSDTTIYQYSFPFKISGLSGSTATGSQTTSTFTGSTVTQQVTQVSTVTSTTASSSVPNSSHSSTLSTATSSASTSSAPASSTSASTTGAPVSVSPTPTTGTPSTSKTSAPALSQTPNAAAHAAIGGTAFIGTGMFFAAMLL